MKITILEENTTENENLIAEHGLSVLIEANDENILVDTGQTDAFLHNADVLGIDIKNVDRLFLSHGHYDHCGGAIAFASANKKASVYISDKAFGEYYNTKDKFIGIDKNIKDIENLNILPSESDGITKINDNISVFTSVREKAYFPFGNRTLLERKGEEEFIQDEFVHEQYVVIEENGKLILISGCAHRGIVNIIRRFVTLYGKEPDAVISGFHLMKKEAYLPEETDLIIGTAKELCKYNTAFYSGHCTGDALPVLKEIMGDKLTGIHTGFSFTI